MTFYVVRLLEKEMKQQGPLQQETFLFVSGDNTSHYARRLCYIQHCLIHKDGPSTSQTFLCAKLTSYLCLTSK